MPAPSPRSLLVLVAIAFSGIGGAACQPGPPIQLTSPGNNAFHELGATGDKLEVKGWVDRNAVDLSTALVTLHLNEVSLFGTPIPVTLDSQGKFSVLVDVDYRVSGASTQRGLNTVFARLRIQGDPLYDRRAAATFVLGEEANVEWGDAADPAVALRLNEAGLNEVAGAVSGTLEQGVDIAALIGEDGAGNPRQILDDQCIPASSCTFEVDGFVTLVSYGTLGVDLDARGPSSPTPSQTLLGVDISNLAIHFEAYDVAPPFANVYCSGTIRANPLRMESFLDQAPAGQGVAVSQLAVQAGLANFQLTFDGDPQDPQLCGYPPLTSFLQTTLAPQLEALATQQIAAALEDPDGTGPGRPLIEEAVEDAINGLALQQQLEPDLRMDLNGTFTRIEEDDDGITYWTRTTPIVTATDCDDGEPFPGACPTLGTSSYLVPLSSNTPVAQATAPNGTAYDLGVYLSESFLGQIVRGFAEAGGLSGVIDSLPDCPLYTPVGQRVLSAGCLFQDDPQLLAATGLVATDILEIRHRPTAAPVFPGGAGPLGSHAALQLGGLVLDLRHPAAAKPLLTRILIRLNGGLSLVFDPVSERLAFEIEYCTDPTTCTPDSTATALSSAFPSPTVSPALLDLVVNGTILPDVILPTLTEGIASFAVPTLLGLELDEVQTTPDQGFLGLFLDLIPPPPCVGCQ